MNFTGRFNVVTVCFCLTLLTLTGCWKGRQNLSPMPSINHEVKANLSAPVNCRTARQDIKALEEEKASVGKQVLSGVRSIFPIAAIAGLLLGDYSDRVEVATGQYNADIGIKIDQIKNTCNLK